MEHELAKELKDNGFPQEGKGTWWNYVVSSSVDKGEEFATRKDFWQESESHWESEKAVYYYVPTLSELIEECGDVSYTMSKRDGLWHASFDICINKCKECNHTLDFGMSSQEKIFAMLWLALNK